MDLETGIDRKQVKVRTFIFDVHLISVWRNPFRFFLVKVQTFFFDVHLISL